MESISQIKVQAPPAAAAAGLPEPARAGARTSPEDLLVEQVRNGDVVAFEILLNRYQDRLTRLVSSILKDSRDTEEVVQDVFLTVFEKVDRFRGDASFSTWIHRIAVNAALMHKRRDKSGTDISLDDVMPFFDDRDRLVTRVADWSEQTRDPVMQQEALQVIQAAVDQLDSKYRIVFVLRFGEGFSTEETARILDMSIPAVKSRLHRARLLLRKRLAAYFDSTYNSN